MEHIHNIDASEDANGFGADRGFGPEAAGKHHQDPVIDVEVEEIAPDTDFRAGAHSSSSRYKQERQARADQQAKPGRASPNQAQPSLAQRFNTDTQVHGQSLAQLAVHSLWIVDYVRGLGQTEMADGDLDSLVRCADDLENAITLMFQLAGGTRMELRQRYQDQRMAIFTQATGRERAPA